jgi:hypothetical protein
VQPPSDAGRRPAWPHAPVSSTINGNGCPGIRAALAAWGSKAIASTGGAWHLDERRWYSKVESLQPRRRRHR